MAGPFEGGSTVNFKDNVGGQANVWAFPEIFSKQVLIAFRKAAVAEAVCNTDYMGEIKQYGDTVKIIKEPQITVSSYTRGATLSSTPLTDAEETLTIDQAKYFQFEEDDIEKKMSHINWQQLASDNAGYAMRDTIDSNILAAILAGVDSGNKWGTTGSPIDTGFDTNEVDPLDVLLRLARYLDEDNVPSENRWCVASPSFYEELAKTSSKLLSTDFNGSVTDLQNGLVDGKKIRGFQMYMSNNTPTWSTTAVPVGHYVLAGHKSAVSYASNISTVEVLRSTTTFADIVRGLTVFGRKVLRPTGLALATIKID